MGGTTSKYRDKEKYIKEKYAKHVASNTRNQNQKTSRISFSLPVGQVDNEEGSITAKGENEYLKFAACSNSGYEANNHRKTNQDAFVAIPEYGEPAISLFGVFDGHGACGHLVAQFVRSELPRMMDQEMLRVEACQENPNTAIVLAQIGRHLMATYERVNSALESDKSIDSSLSGTTAVAGLVIGRSGSRRIVMANSGDSRAILAYEEGGQLKAKPLSEDQKPDLERERQRILKCGGRVEPLSDEHGNPIGPHRVWLSNMMLPGLAMARSIGDDIAATAGVYALPDILVHEITEQDRFMVLASDGVWEFMKNEEVVKIVERCNGNADKAAREVCLAAYREWKSVEEVVDDITTVVVYFKKA